MRRSLAPSQGQVPAKKPFLPPYKPKDHLAADANSERSCKLTNHFASVESRKENLPITSTSINKPVANACREGEKLFFNVMYCNRSNKKHKTWLGEGVLIAHERSVTLLDDEGKQISKSSGYRKSELQKLSEGESLFVGGKEIEVMGRIPEEQYRSGQCFSSTQCAVQSELIAPAAKKPQVKAFVNPLRGQSAGATTVSSRPVAPRYNPNAPDALVMPRPSAEHQWSNNDSRAEVVDVVVDPALSSVLRPHQRDGVKFLYRCLLSMTGAILADEMGLGKTLQCITLIWTLLKQGPYGTPLLKRIVIVTPGSLVKNWAKELRKWLGREKLQFFCVDQFNSAEEFVKQPIPVLVISYEMFVRKADVLRSVNFDLVICDEGHRLKNTGIKTTQLISSCNISKRLILSGTPVQNNLQEFFSLADFCNPGVFGTAASFRQLFQEPIRLGQQPGASPEQKELSEARSSRLQQLSASFMLRRTQDVSVNFLCSKVEDVVFCRPTPLQCRLYEALLRSRAVRSCVSAGYRDDSRTPVHLLCIGALKKLCNHPALLYSESCSTESEQDEMSLYSELRELYPAGFEQHYLSAGVCGKFDVVRSMLAQLHQLVPREKIVLISNYTQTLDVLDNLCRTEGYVCLRLDGQTATQKRMNIVDQFNSSHSPHTILLLSSKAGGTGLNLIGASRLILYDIDWNPAHDLQAMARIWREGQKKRVYIYRLLTTGTIEEKIYQRQIMKQGVSSAVIGSSAQTSANKQHFTREELKDLFTLHEANVSHTHDLLNCECHVTGEQARAPTAQVVRSCQLGQPPPSTKQSAIGMNELLKWKHIVLQSTSPNVLEESLDDALLTAASSNVTFVFRNLINSLPTATEG